MLKHKQKCITQSCIAENVPLQYVRFSGPLDNDGLIYSCPMKAHHSPDAHICGLSKAVQNCAIYNYYLGQISIPVTPLTHDVTSASKLR